MKFNLFVKSLILTLAFTSSFNLIKQAKGQSQREFICGESFDREEQKRLPTTFAWTNRGKVVIIRWTDDFGTKYTPAKRCEYVSPRFQKAYNNGTLGMITNGTMNNQSVICTTNETGGECHTLLMTLRKEDNSLAIINNLRRIFDGQQVGPVKHDGGTPQIYYQIDIDKFIRNAPVE